MRLVNSVFPFSKHWLRSFFNCRSPFTKHFPLPSLQIINTRSGALSPPCFCGPQTHADYRGLCDEGDTVDANPLLEAEIEAQRREAAWLDSSWQVDPGKRQKKRHRPGNKTYRQAAYSWVLELDNMLQCGPHGGPGLRKWQVPHDWKSVKGDAVLEWPCLSGSADQGPDGWTARIFLALQQAIRLQQRAGFV